MTKKPKTRKSGRKAARSRSFDGASWREGARRRDDGIDRAEAHAKAVWLASAALAVRAVASMRSLFTTDHVWAHLFALGEQGKNGEELNRPAEPRAMGAVMRAASREEVCERTDQTVCSVRASCHRRPLRLWRSKIIQGSPKLRALIEQKVPKRSTSKRPKRPKKRRT